MKKSIGVLAGIASVVIGTEHIEGSMIVETYGVEAYHVLNAVMGYGFGAGLATFLANVGHVLRVAEAFARWFVAACISLLISSIYLAGQFYRIYGADLQLVGQ